MQGGATDDSWSEYFVPDTTTLFVVTYEVLEQDHVNLTAFYDDLALDFGVIECDYEHTHVRLQDTYLSRRVHDQGLESALASRHGMLHLRCLEEVLGLLLKALRQYHAYEVLDLADAQDWRQ